jgi:hypothetical protein
MARISKEKADANGGHWKKPEHVARRLNKSARNPTLIPARYMVARVASFSFRFSSVEQLRACLVYYQLKTRPSSRYPAKKLAAELGDDWRTQRGWEVERWFERLPMYLLEEPKRQKVLRALSKALHLVEVGKFRF